MKKLYTFLIATFIGASGLFAQNVIFSDDFETAGFPSGYTIHDLDGNTVRDQPQGFASLFDTAWIRVSFQGDPNLFIASTSQYNPAGVANDWVITSQISLTTNNYLFFKTRSGSATRPDGFEVKLSTTTNEVDSFNVNLLTVNSASTSWTTHAIDLSAYSNQTVYIAWRNITNDGYILALDDIEVAEVLNGDARIEEVTVASKVEENSTVNITGSIEHLGTDTLNSVDVNWRINGGTVNTQTISGLSLKYGETQSFSHNATFTPSNAGSFSNLEVWTSNPNSQADPNPANDTISKNIFVVLGNGVQRNVLFEEFTTAACVWCPDGHVVMANILAQNPNIIPVSVHSCFGTDAMTNQEAIDLCDTLGNNSAPTGMMDRFQHDGDDEPAHSRTVWQSRANARSQVPSSANVGITGSYNDSTRSTVVSVDVDFVDYELPGDIRLSLMIIEDSVSGTGQGWDQRNALNNRAGHPMQGRGDPIVGYQHRHVLRDILPSTWGDANVIPSNVVPNTTYNKTFTFNLDNNYKSKDVSFVAVVSYKGNDTDEYEVINAEEVPMFVLTSVAELETANASFDVYPNPASDITTMDLTLTENLPLDITVFDITGKAVINKNYGEMVKGEHKLPINVSALPNGFYIMRVQAGEEVLSKKISVNR